MERVKNKRQIQSKQMLILSLDNDINNSLHRCNDNSDEPILFWRWPWLFLGKTARNYTHDFYLCANINRSFVELGLWRWRWWLVLGDWLLVIGYWWWQWWKEDIPPWQCREAPSIRWRSFWTTIPLQRTGPIRIWIKIIIQDVPLYHTPLFCLNILNTRVGHSNMRFGLCT